MGWGQQSTESEDCVKRAGTQGSRRCRMVRYLDVYGLTPTWREAVFYIFQTIDLEVEQPYHHARAHPQCEEYV